jgi:hypothetical protein
MTRTLLCLALLAAAGSALAQKSNTAPTRSFTTEWACDNGRKLLINAHPRRPREEAHITYIGNRVEVFLKGPVAEGRYVSKDGKVEWTLDPKHRNEGRLKFDGLPDTPVTCVRIDPEPAKK